MKPLDQCAQCMAQNAFTPKSSLQFSKHRSCALLCAGFSMTREWRSLTISILNYCFSKKNKGQWNAKSGPKVADGNVAMRTKDPYSIGKLCAKYQFCVIHTADNTDGKVTNVHRF